MTFLLEVFMTPEKKPVNPWHKRPEKGSILDEISRESPSLLRAYQLTKVASGAGFDWPDLSGVLEKLDEEIDEFREALSSHSRPKIQEELGDLLFVLTNVARFLQINPEEALKGTIDKFILRFRYIETALRRRGRSLPQSSLVEMDRLWEEAKKIKRRAKSRIQRH